MSKHRSQELTGEQPGRDGGFGTRVFTETELAAWTDRADARNPVTASWARMRLRIDANRRRNAAARAAGIPTGGRLAVAITKFGAKGAGGGRWRAIGRPVEYRGTTAQIAGLWPWGVGAGAPLLGTPVGTHLRTGASVSVSPTAWFMHGLITAPTAFIMALNGFGKSSLVRRLLIGGMWHGMCPLVLADVKPDYRRLIEAVGGQVIDVGFGYGTINPLDAGVLAYAFDKLARNGFLDEATGLVSEIRAKQVTLVASLIELVRGRRIEDYEETLISTALRVLHMPVAEGGRGFTLSEPPLLEDLAKVIDAGGEELMLDAAARTDEEYDGAVIGLRRSLRALTAGPFGRLFNGPTTTPIQYDSVGVCVDISHLPRADRKLLAAVMLTTWSTGFAAVDALNKLADVGLEKQRYWKIVIDELWRVLGLGEFMGERVDELIRLQREDAATLLMISHSSRDLRGRDTANRALGLLERSRMKIFGALPRAELDALAGTVEFTGVEYGMVTSWSGGRNTASDQIRHRRRCPRCDLEKRDPRSDEPAPGTGKFLIKVTEDRTPGIPVQMVLTDAEIRAGIHDTSARYTGSEFDEPTWCTCDDMVAAA